MTAFFSYILLGLSLAAPIGPINAAQLDKGIKNGFFHAWFVGIGAMTADIIYMICVYFGLVHFLEVPLIKTFLYLFGCFVLLYTGIESIMTSKKSTANHYRNSESIWKTYTSGFFMSLSNPLTILFWLGIYGSVLANTIQKVDASQLILYSCAIFIGVFLWDLMMAGMASGFRKILNSNFLSLISVGSGLSLIYFGIYFGKEAVKILLSY